MDITRDLKQQKKKSERGSEKSSHGNIAPKDSDETVEVDGKIYRMPADLNDLEEIDYDDPGVKSWLAEQEAESIRNYGKLTSEEAEYMFSRRLVLEKEFPEKSALDLNQQALREFRSTKRD